MDDNLELDNPSEDSSLEQAIACSSSNRKKILWYSPIHTGMSIGFFRYHLNDYIFEITYPDD